MERAGGKRPVTVDNSAGTVVIGDGNRVVAGAPPAVRSAYREQVRRIAPAELLGREEELAELGDFCRTGTGYVWWRAEAWAGKTALMASLALDPPRARECTALALHLGSWSDVLPAVFHCDPGTVPLVLAEAERLRRALEV
ncbi:hypothetical protein [Streptomyces sp. NPDC002463]|uniref:hypothetical protein n=1 Tax=Streptomyces sp. NPDC002463 TaxID=3364645 RepID=UPI00369B35E6